MEEKKKSKNIYGIISLCLMVLTFILEFIGLMNANFIFVVLSIIIGISGIVLAIIGIVKATKLKKQIGKLKGIVLSIISIVFILGILVLSIMEFIVLIYEQTSGDTEFSALAKSASLTEDEKVLGQYIKQLKNSLNDIDSFKLNNVYTYKLTSGNGRLEAVIDYSGKNLMGGTTREFIVLTYSYKDGYTSVCRKKTLEEAEKITYNTPSIQTKTTINTNKLLKYANEDTTPELKVDYDQEKVQKKLTDAVKVMGK